MYSRKPYARTPYSVIISAASGAINKTVNLTGIAATDVIGTPSIHRDFIFTIATSHGTGALGTVIVSGGISITINPTGRAATGALGSPTLAISDSLPVTGINGTGALGTITLTIPSTTILPTGELVIDFTNSLTTGLIAAYVPASYFTTQQLRDLTGLALNLAVPSAGSFSTTPEGLGYNTSAASSGASAAAPAGLQQTTTVSVYWRGEVLTGGLTNNTGDTSFLVGVNYNSTGSFPTYAYGIIGSCDAANDAGLIWDNTTTSINSTAGYTPAATNTMQSLGGTWLGTGSALFYQGGALFNSTVFGGTHAIAYGSGPTIEIGGTTGVTTQNNTATTVVFIWSRVLTSTEMASLDANPYQFLLPISFVGNCTLGTITLSIVNGGATNINLTPTGIAATGALGSPTLAISFSKSITATGLFAAAALGTPTLSLSRAILVSGISANGVLGTSSSAGDPNWANVALLLPFDGNLTDVSLDNHTSNFGGSGASFGTTSPEFGSGYLITTGFAGGGYLIVSQTSSELLVGNQPFTIEGWVQFTTLGVGPQLICSMGVTHFSSLSYEFGFDDTSGTNITFSYSTDGTAGTEVDIVSPITAPSTGVWYHYAVDRDASNNLRLYVNGVVISTHTAAATLFADTSDNFYLGFSGWNSAPSGLWGQIDEFRLTTGVARYAGAFTPATIAFPIGAGGSPYLPVTITGGGATNITINETGLAGSGAIGTLSLAISKTDTLTGINANGAIGTPTLTIIDNATITPAGLAAFGVIDTPALALSSNLHLVGLAASGAITNPGHGISPPSFIGLVCHGAVGTITLARAVGPSLPGIIAYAVLGRAQASTTEVEPPTTTTWTSETEPTTTIWVMEIEPSTLWYEEAPE